jgi:hypothetical protein
VKPTPPNHIVGFLRFPPDCCEHLDPIFRFSSRKWRRVLQWLDDTGLAFYFLQKLKDTDATRGVPAPVLASLERNFAANQQRMEALANRFSLVNRKLSNAGMHYAVVKGFSLVPEFCPSASLRYQADLDYLLGESSWASAPGVLLEMGYRLRNPHSEKELIFLTPDGGPSRSADQYSPEAPHAVELHLDMWDKDLHRVPTMEKLLSVSRAKAQEWNGIVFPGFSDEDAFLLQVLHTCRHLFTYWIRTSCLYEIAYFLNRRSSDVEFWHRIEQQVGGNLELRELVVVTAELVSQLFSVPLPQLICTWGRQVRTATRVWIERYARDCALGDLPAYHLSFFPKAKFALFLHQEFDNGGEPETLVHARIVTTSRLKLIAASLRKEPSLMWNMRWWKQHLLLRRTIFHAMAGARYLCEIPRWRWRNRKAARSAIGEMAATESSYRIT